MSTHYSHFSVGVVLNCATCVLALVVLALSFFLFLARGAPLSRKGSPARLGVFARSVRSRNGFSSFVANYDGDGVLPVDGFLEKKLVRPSYGGKRRARNA